MTVLVPDYAMFREITSQPWHTPWQAKGCPPFIGDICPTIGSVAALICDRVIFTVRKNPWNEIHSSTALISRQEQYLLDYRIYADTLAKLSLSLNITSVRERLTGTTNRTLARNNIKKHYYSLV